MDLGSLSSVRAAARQLVERDVMIDVVINNAGIMAVPSERTADGFEMQFGVNHLGHFLFMNLLLKEGRIREGGGSFMFLVMGIGWGMCGGVMWV
jgi:NAD(P)-dependent dehydrogenase (short-subunit alcohol dehydrogenase family)